MKHIFLFLGSFFSLCEGSNQIYIHSTSPDEFLGRGIKFSWDDEVANFETNNNALQTYNPGKVIVMNVDSKTNNFNYWNIKIGSSQETKLVKGVYRFAEQNNPRRGKISLGANFTACNLNFGNFEILDVQYENNKLISLALNFEFFCENVNRPKVLGALRYQSDISINENIQISTQDTTFIPHLTNDSFQFESLNDDYIGFGMKRKFGVDDGMYTVKFEKHAPYCIRAYFRGGSDGVFVHRWSLKFCSARNSQLEVGEYFVRLPIDYSQPTMAVTGISNYTCNRVEGAFRVRELVVENDSVTKLAVDFTKMCGGRGPLIGAFRFDSQIPADY